MVGKLRAHEVGTLASSFHLLMLAQHWCPHLCDFEKFSTLLWTLYFDADLN